METWLLERREIEREEVNRSRERRGDWERKGNNEERECVRNKRLGRTKESWGERGEGNRKGREGAQSRGGGMGGGLLFCCISQRCPGLRRSNYLPVRLIVHPYASGDTRPGLWEMAQIHYVGHLTTENGCLRISGSISSAARLGFLRWWWLLCMQMMPLSLLLQDVSCQTFFFFFFFSCFHVFPSLLPFWLAEIFKFVFIISPPQQNTSLEKNPIRIPQELQLWRPFHTAQWDRNKAYVLQSGYTNYSLPVTRKRERRQRRHQRQNALSFLSLSHCASQACLPDGEERFVKRITVERVKPFQAPGKIEGDICM